MRQSEVLPALIKILKSAKGQFLSSYGLCGHLKRAYPVLWSKILAEYPSQGTQMGAGFGHPFSPASFIGLALVRLAKSNNLIATKVYTCVVGEPVLVGFTPGFRGNRVMLFAYI